MTCRNFDKNLYHHNHDRNNNHDHSNRDHNNRDHNNHNHDHNNRDHNRDHNHLDHHHHDHDHHPHICVSVRDLHQRLMLAYPQDLPKERLVAWRQESYKINKLGRTFGNTKMITWKNGRDPATPFAQATDKCDIALRAPSAISVAWLNKSKADLTISIGDTRPVYVNPSMMACYGIELDSKWWSLIAKDLERSSPDAINSWYLLGEAAKQFRAVGRPHDFTGYMWMWAALKSGDENLWKEHIDQFIATERQAYSMVTSKEEELTYKPLTVITAGQVLVPSYLR
ncbi:kinesin-related protein 10-like [Dermacentor silvarum]|uniref:kinesin-related protein 10-like n=1 Tax=Dermacentor silvarum TaxID=543639 RepID=UPI002100FC71|nr:kinesin-related protein 10-like [Dermacentor silvarum]